MEKASKNTQRVIESANRSLELHRKRFGMAPSKNRYHDFEEIASENNRNVSSLKKLEEKSSRKITLSIPKSRAVQESILSTSDFQNESFIISEKKVVELENRISNILEYSSQLEKTIKTNLDSAKLNINAYNNKTMNNHCCCNNMDESKIVSIVKETVLSIANNSKGTKNAFKPEIILSHLDLERLSDQILDICFDEVIENIDNILEKVSRRLIETIVN
ncbi:hypothetical protein FG386_000969 [Cryptosporidium ryanae]|uniref:uncharacterized protein n=1 Tax=Cryptosporidium ryanae TaxID=515981 RepID=UPI00351A2F6A|nr:hypothetical protein FG386_000969 [Cryptosporidium ryanae]